MMQLTVLPNGLCVASRTMPSVETVAVGLYADAGSRHEPARVNGIAHLFEHMVFKGAGGRSAREISEAIEDVGGDLNACTDREGTSFTASLLAEHLPLGIEMLSDLILRPHFAPADLAREKEVVLQELGEARDTPSDIIFDELWSVAYPQQPLGRSILGDEASIAAITDDDLHDWRLTPYRTGSLYLVAAGKVDHEALVRLAEARFAGLSEGALAPAETARFGGGARASEPRSDQALGRSILGDEASIAAIELADLHAWRTERYRAGSLYLVAAGKVDHDALVALAETRFAGLPEGMIDQAEAARFAGGVRSGGARADQAHLASAYAAPALLNPDYYAARLFSDLVGSGASSRLFQAVREER
ncbi:MAG: M16 family metallopeptidase, partial [Allosphingosinicella sp.]